MGKVKQNLQYIRSQNPEARMSTLLGKFGIQSYTEDEDLLDGFGISEEDEDDEEEDDEE